MESIFSLTHIIYILVFALFTTVLIIVTRLVLKNHPLAVRWFVIGFAILILIVAITNRIIIVHNNNERFTFWTLFVHGGLCRTFSIWGPVIMIAAKPKSKLLQLGLFAMALGGLLTTIYPDFVIGQPTIFEPEFFTGMVYHTLMLVAFIYLIAIGYFKPTFKNYWSFPLGLALLVPYVLFQSQVFGAHEAMYLFEPAIEGTPFTWWVIGLLAILVYTIFLTIYEQFAYVKEERFLNNLILKIKEKISKCPLKAKITKQ